MENRVLDGNLCDDARLDAQPFAKPGGGLIVVIGNVCDGIAG